MPLSAAISHFLNRRERHQHERLGEQDDEQEPAPAALPSSPNTGVGAAPTELEASDEDADADTDGGDFNNEDDARDPPPANEASDGDADNGDSGDDHNNEGDSAAEHTSESRRRQRRRSSARLDERRLLELEEERDLRRRRQSMCTLILVFALFRLWIEALTEGDPGVLLLCLVGTSWTARWIRTRREQEEELDRRIEAYARRVRSGDGSAATVDDVFGLRSNAEAELSLMSFQAQLALAIIESQRQMMENGGYNNAEPEPSQGVTERVRDGWERFKYSHPPSLEKGERRRSSRTKAGGYGSVFSEDADPSELEAGLAQGEDSPKNGQKEVKFVSEEGEEEPSCSICLCEYEEGETVVRLPCDHAYHGDCVEAWTSNHIRCPLCNYDLMNGEAESAGGRAGEFIV